MSYTLGLDLGSNSVGWALVDEATHQILRSGVRVFPEGVDRDKQGGEVSKAQNRRTARGMRRQIARRARRKRRLMQILIAAGLLPGDPAERQAVFELNPYEIRARGLDTPLTPFELGRAIMSLNQRRGFLSNRKSGSSKGEKEGMLKEISDLQAEIERSGARTLGEYLNRLYEAEGINVRLRGRHTRRQMIEHEFNSLWNAQRPHHPGLTDELRSAIWDRTIAFQRAMYWPKYAVGRCDLEPRERRCRRAHRLAERFRLLQEVNNLRIIEPTGEERPLAEAEREKLITYLSAAKERTFDEIRKHLGLLESYGFNLEFGDRRKLLGLPTDVLLGGKKYFGKLWAEMPEDTKNGIVEALLEDTLDEAVLHDRLAQTYGVDAEIAAKLAAIELPSGYASYSLVAIKRLLPHLEAGLPLSGSDNNDAIHGAGYLRPDERTTSRRDELPAAPGVGNPLVGAALAQVRQVVNAIIREHGKPDAIHIELAREVKGSAQQRAEQASKMRERERQRAAAAAEVEKTTKRPATRRDVDRYLMWKDQRGFCMYSGRAISQAQLFNGDVDVDHILPYSRSLDDSRLNKVLALRSENQAKGNRTPYEWLAETDPEKYEEVLQRAKTLPLDIRNGMLPKFAAKDVKIDDFIQRQLNDTKYISRKAAEYLRCLTANVVCTKGQCTAELRHHWGLDRVLGGKESTMKNRDDHRHHAVDALVIALTSRSRLQQLARGRGERNYPPPWDGFVQAAGESINRINVSHRVVRKVNGQLHEETVYGPTAKPWRGGAEARRDIEGRVAERPWARGWVEEEGKFTYRKPLTDLTVAMIDDIRDEVVRKLVWERLSAHGITGESKTIPKSVWREPLRMPGPKGALVKKVRLVKNDKTITPIRGGRGAVKPGSNHHVCVFEYSDGGAVRRDAIWVSRLEAARRLRAGEVIINRTHPTRPDARFLMSLTPGEMVLGTFKGQERLCVFLTGASTTNQMLFCAHSDARKSSEVEKFSAVPATLRARKVTVDPLGRIRWAND